MRKLKTIMLGVLFMSGLSAMATKSDKSVNSPKTDLKKNVPCPTVYTVCDNAHPDNFEAFANCMEANGCG
ncbi:hypothetical protein [Mesoflavibacter sp. CH_XMU1422-2]|uniref:hypothetical protein n=1 Tax=Mesoflavibacter sp. CH_XMU1422-2 TaxID=3107770 RepID=UPI00300BA164